MLMTMRHTGRSICVSRLALVVVLDHVSVYIDFHLKSVILTFVNLYLIEENIRCH
jgi:hypothetical protein